jgi:hypothetical protein
MKSEVKKKMMLDRHTTPTPKSLKRAQEENSFAQNVLGVPVAENSIPKLDIIESPIVPYELWFTTNLPHEHGGAAASEFIFFRPETSIIEKHEIIGGAHKWPLSTMW